MKLGIKLFSKILLLISLVVLSGCDFNSSLSGRWVHKDKAITFEFFKSGDVLIDAPCFSYISLSGKYEILDSDNLRLDAIGNSRIYSLEKNNNAFSLSTNTKDVEFTGHYVDEKAYQLEVSKLRKPRKSESKYWYTEKKNSDGEYEFIGVKGDKGWNITNLGDGSIRGDFHGCSGGYPLKSGQSIFSSTKKFNKDSYSKILNSNTDKSLNFLNLVDIDKGALEFRYVFDGFDNKRSLESQERFFQKNNRGCLFSYGTPIVYEKKRSMVMYIPRRCGSSQSDFVVAKAWKNKSSEISSDLKLINIPHFGRYWKTDCSPSYYFTDVGADKVNLRLVFTTEYGQSYKSKPNGDCGSPKQPQFVKDVEIDV